MKETTVTCILCPISCRAKVTQHDEEDHDMTIENLECPRGEQYVIHELRAPVRDFFTTVKVEGAAIAVLPVRTTAPIPKEKIMECARALSNVVVEAPILLGTVIVKNLLNLGVDVISTRDLEKA